MEVRFGGFWRRLMAFFVDKIILFFISLFVLFGGFMSLRFGFPSLGSGFAMERFVQISFAFFSAYYLTMLLVGMLYFTYFHGTTGQTPGKIIFGLRVVQATGEKMTLGVGFLRWVGYIVSTAVFFIGFAWIAIDGKKRGWHDRIAGTVVVRVENIVDGLSFSCDEKYLDKGRDII
ncbi:MAG: RDD family protein [Deltaproteobacteria bacterium]|nr:RDD family protein [Deltaproteobacteria bacterium]